MRKLLKATLFAAMPPVFYWISGYPLERGFGTELVLVASVFWFSVVWYRG